MNLPAGFFKDGFRAIRDNEEDRNVFLTQRQIAFILGTSQQVIQKTLRRAERKFREKWIELYGDEAADLKGGA